MGPRYRSPPARSKRGLCALLPLLLLASCGRVGDLRPPPGQSLPVKPKLAAATPTPEELITPPPIARPVRVDEILRRSEPRRPDKFDLPPPSGAEAAPVPEGNSQTPPNEDQTRVQEPR